MPAPTGLFTGFLPGPPHVHRCVYRLWADAGAMADFLVVVAVVAFVAAMLALIWGLERV